MPTKLFSSITYTVTFITLFAIDYILGNGFVEFFQNTSSKLKYFIRKSIREEEKAQLAIEPVDNVNLSVLITEIILLGLTLLLLNKYKQFRCKDRIDDLLQESREALRQTNEFLDKWRMRRMNMNLPDEYSYLDEEPQEITPYKLDVPILHMAIIDTLGTARNQPESGDAGDRTSYTDSALLTINSLLDEDFNSAIDEASGESLEDSKAARNRVLWDVQEEWSNLDD